MGVGEVKGMLSFDPLTLGCPAWNRVGLRQRSDSLKRTPKEKWAEPTGGLDAS